MRLACLFSALIFSATSLASPLHSLGRMNHLTVLEAAGSHGSTSTIAGAGLASHWLSASETRHLSSWENDSTSANTASNDSSQWSMPRVFALQGTPLPIDLGASAGQTLDGTTLSYGAYLQWTAYEALGTPAVALRAGISNLSFSGLSREADISTQSYALVVSQGMFQFFQFYTAANLETHTGQSRSTGRQKLLLSDSDLAMRSESDTWSEGAWTLGGQIRVFTPHFFVTLENRFDQDARQTLLGKASLEM
jgi:hypothetical protein